MLRRLVVQRGRRRRPGLVRRRATQVQQARVRALATRVRGAQPKHLCAKPARYYSAAGRLAHHPRTQGKPEARACGGPTPPFLIRIAIGSRQRKCEVF